MDKYLRRGCWTIGGMTLAVVMIGAALTVPVARAEENSNTDKVNVNIPVACTMSGVLNSAHSTSIISGTQSVTGIGETEIDTICNDKDGYIIYAMGTTQNASQEVILQAAGGYGSDIKTGTGTAADGRSSWGMKLTPVTSGSGQYPPDIDSTYLAYTSVPNTWTPVASKDSSISNPAHSKFTTTYSVYVTTDQPAGNYSGQVKYVMLHPSTTSVLPTNTLEQAFADAGKEKIEVTDSVTGQTGKFYKMQDMENAICNAATYVDSNNSIQLVDTRDKKLYWVTKLQDGKCWMTQNLDLDLGIKNTTLGIDTTVLTSSDTDLNDNSLSGAYNNNYEYDAATGVISWKPANVTRNYSSGTGTSWVNDYNKAYSMDVGEWYWDGDNGTQACNFISPPSGTTCDHFSQSRANANKHLSVGNYYNWSAAIASDNSSSLNSSTYGNAQSDPNATSRNPQNSICPKGWRLPTISYQANSLVNSTSEFSRINLLYNGSGDTGLIANPLWFVRSGYISNGSLSNGGSEAYYWSSTVSNSVYAYLLYFTSGSVIPANASYRNYGWSVRCVARWY